MDYIRLKLYYPASSSYYSQDFPSPKKFEMKKVPNIVNEIHTMSGNTLYDINGWKYADTTLEWGVLYPEVLTRLITFLNTADSNLMSETITSTPTLYLEFIEPGGTTQSVKTVVKNFKKAKTLVRYGSDYVWEGVALELSFPECYQYS